MLKYFVTPAGSKVSQQVEEIQENAWIYMENPSDFEIETICKSTGITEEFIKAALDEEERARIEVEDGVKLTIIDIPVMTEEKDWYVYSTLPLSVITTDKYFVTVCLKSTTVLNNFMNNKIKSFDINKKSRFLYQILYSNAVKFLHYLKQIDKASSRVQTLLHKSMKNKELIQLLDLEKSLVYFSTSLNSNQVVLDKIVQSNFVKHFEEDQEILNDVVIENRQAIEMCSIYRDILGGTMDAYASVISNNQNIVLKLLAGLTIILAIPQLLASLFGMNVGVPWEGDIIGFWIVISVSAVLMIFFSIIMIRKNMF